MNKQTKTILTEVAKTAAGAVIGRTAVVYGEKALKVHEETDPKKKKMKEVGVGLAVAGAGTIGAMKLDNSLKSVAAGVATAGLISAASPFGKEDQGFIPVLHGADDIYPETENLEDEIRGLGGYTEIETIEDDEIDNEINALEAVADEIDENEDQVADQVSVELN
jgi:hypothetical protein